MDDALRRELRRAEKAAGLRRLEALVAAVEHLPLTTAVRRPAASLCERHDRPRDSCPVWSVCQ